MKRLYIILGLLTLLVAIPEVGFSQDERERKAVEERDKKRIKVKKRLRKN